jgi:hypothetical protein
MRFHCTKCYYWARRAEFGRGKVSAWFFKQGDPSQFCLKELTWKDMIPDFLLTLVPLLTGILLLILEFRTGVLLALVVMVLLTTIGNALIRGKLTWRHCKQRELGCPADALFNKNRNTNSNI